MHDSKLSKLFERYRAKGDLGALAEVFDIVSPELLRVARHVAGRGSDPEDLVQATFLAAIERAVTFDASRPLVPWLMGILINQSRIAKRRMRGGQLEAEDDLPAATLRENDAESHEIGEAVSRALDELPDAYREVLMPHLAEGKKPHEIARDLGRPQGTVRAQIHRGIRLLRKSLPAGFALGALALLRPNALAAVRLRVLEAAARQNGLDPSAAASIPGPRGSMRPKLAAAGATALVGVAAWLAWPRTNVDAAAGVAVAAPPASAARERPTALQAPLDGEVRTAVVTHSTSAPIAGAIDGSYGSFALRVVRGSTSEPVPDVHVTLLAWGDPRWFEHVLEARTNGAGEAQFPRVPAGRVGIHLDGGTQLREDVVAGRETRMETALEAGIAVHAIVFDERGKPLESAVVEVYADSDGAPISVSAPTGIDGSVELREVDRRRWIAARASGRASSARVWLGIPTLSTTRAAAIELRVREASAAFDGIVVDEDGAAIEHALVRVTSGDPVEAVWRPDGGVELGPPATFASCDARGRFRVDAPPRGSLRLHVEAPKFAAQDLLREDGDASFLRVRLEAAARVVGRASFADGSPAAFARIELVPEQGGARSSVHADAGGAFLVEGLRAGAFEAAARAGDIGPATTRRLVLEPGATTEWSTIVEHPPTIEGIALGENGKPLKAWLVFATPEDEPVSAADASPLAEWGRCTAAGDTKMRMVQCWTAPDGRFVVPCQDGSMQRLELRARAGWRGGPRTAIGHVAPGSRDVVLRDDPQRGHFLGRIVDTSRRPIGVCTIVAVSHDASGDLHVPCDPATGRFEIEILPGTYELLAWPEHGCVRRLGQYEVARNGRLELGDLPIDAPGALRVASAVAPRIIPVLTDAHGLRFALERAADGSCVAEGLPPGVYRLTVPGRAARDLEIHPRETTVLRPEPE